MMDSKFCCKGPAAIKALVIKNCKNLLLIRYPAFMQHRGPNSVGHQYRGPLFLNFDGSCLQRINRQILSNNYKYYW